MGAPLALGHLIGATLAITHITGGFVGHNSSHRGHRWPLVILSGAALNFYEVVGVLVEVNRLLHLIAET